MRERPFGSPNSLVFAQRALPRSQIDALATAIDIFTGSELDLLLLRRGRRWGFEFKCTDAPTTTKSMPIALEDLKLEHLWVVYPGNLRYSMTEQITALPLREISTIELKART